MKKIITHGGASHMDEFIAICLLLAFMGRKFMDLTTIFRRDPTEEELNDPDVCVVDVGMRHEPHLMNFDHHQMEPSQGECAFTLVAKFLGVHDDMLDVFGWYKLAAIMDSQGPGGVAKELGTDFNTVVRLWPSVVEHHILELFAQTEIDMTDHPERPDDRTVREVLYGVGQGIKDNLVEMRRRYEYLSAHVMPARAMDVKGMVLLRDDNEPASPAGIDIYRRRCCPDAAFSVTPDDRGQGYALYRYEDDPRLNFSRLDFDDRILFAHKGGFIAKTKEALDVDELLSLVADAVIPEEKR